MEISSNLFAQLLERVEACMEDAEGGKHRAYHLLMQFYKRGINISMAPSPEQKSIHETSSNLGHG